MSILHLIYSSESDCIFQNIDLEDIETRNNYASKTPTTTLPFLETKEGNISETNSILFYLAQKYKKDLIGQNIFENAKINQWIEFASTEIRNCQKSIIYPIFGWRELNKDSLSRDNDKLKKYLIILDNELNNKYYLVGNRLTLADIVLFRYLRYFMMFNFPEGMRNNKIKNISKWFENIMKTNEAIKAYGRTVLCKIPIKPFMGKIISNSVNYKKEKQEKKEKSEKNENLNVIEQKLSLEEKNELLLLKRSKFNLEKFKNSFLNNKNKEEAMKEFLEEFNPEKYSLWWLEYQNSQDEGNNLSNLIRVKNEFLEKLDKFKGKCFAVHGVYGTEGNYKIRGVWMWQGKDIPKEIEENEYYNHLTIRNLENNNKEDIELVNEYWTKLNKNDKVQRRYVVDCHYFS